MLRLRGFEFQTIPLASLSLIFDRNLLMKSRISHLRHQGKCELASIRLDCIFGNEILLLGNLEDIQILKLYFIIWAVE